MVQWAVTALRERRETSGYSETGGQQVEMDNLEIRYVCVCASQRPMGVYMEPPGKYQGFFKLDLQNENLRPRKVPCWVGRVVFESRI